MLALGKVGGLEANYGSDADVIRGIDWVTRHAREKGWPAVANMSLGGGASPALDRAVCNSIAAGVSYAIAAGNDNANSCAFSPARIGQALTAGEALQGGEPSTQRCAVAGTDGAVGPAAAPHGPQLGDVGGDGASDCLHPQGGLRHVQVVDGRVAHDAG